MERKAPKPDPISSIPCDEGGKRHIKGCPHKKKQAAEDKEDDKRLEDEIYNELIKGVRAGYPSFSDRYTFRNSSSYTRHDRTTFSKEEWQVEYIELLEGTIKTLSLHRAVFAAVLLILAVVAIVR